MRGVPLLVAFALAGCGGGGGDAARAPEPSPTATIVNATEREEMAVSAACSELKRALSDTRPLPRSGAAKAAALRREIDLVRRYRRALQAINPDAVPSWHVGAQIKYAKSIEKAHALHAGAAEKGGRATRGGFPVMLDDPRAIVDDDEQSFGADCG